MDSAGHKRIITSPGPTRPMSRAAFHEKSGIPPDKFLVGDISRLDFQKNQLPLIAAFARFHRKHPGGHLLRCGPETQPDHAVKIRPSTFLFLFRRIRNLLSHLPCNV